MTSSNPAPEFPMRRRCPFEVPAEYADLRETQPITRVRLWDGRSAWLLTRYEDIRTVLRSSAVSSQAKRPNFPFLSSADEFAKLADGSFQRMDGAEHSRHRRMVIPFFTVRRVEAMRPMVKTLVKQLLEEITAQTPPVDFYQEFALAVPSTVACTLLGVPYRDHEFFQVQSALRISLSASREEIGEATQKLLDYLAGLLDERARDPRDDVISFLAEQVASGALSRDEAVMDANLLLLGGHETTANVIAMGTLALLEHPEQITRLTSGEISTANAVEELLRFTSITQSNGLRIAIEDIEIGDHTIPAGDGVIAAVSAANWDGTVFPEPGVLDVGRPEARQHMTFGYGVHQCIGQALARMELEVVFETLFDAVPGIRLAKPIDELRFKDDSAFYGVHELPVSW